MKTITYHLDVFDGPLDLLLHLISKNKVNLYDIPISLILEQYDAALAEMQGEMDLDLLSDFVAMSAHLLYIKSKLLLPRYDESDEDADPRRELVQLLLEYQQFKEISGAFHTRYEVGRDIFVKQPEPLEPDQTYRYSHSAEELPVAVHRMLDRAEQKLPPPISSFSGLIGREVCSVSSRVAFVLKRLLQRGSAPFRSLFLQVQSRSEVVATFLAVLELCKSRRVLLAGDEQNPDITLTKKDA